MTAAPTTPEFDNDAHRGSHCGCSDLLACPFCGSGEVKFSPPANDPDPSDDVLCSWQVVCGQCGATGGNQCDENTARLAWNTRRDHAAFYRELLEQITQDSRKTRARRLAESGLMFLDQTVKEAKKRRQANDPRELPRDEQKKP